MLARSGPGSVLRVASPVSQDEVENGQTGDAEGEKYQGEKQREDRPGIMFNISLYNSTICSDPRPHLV